MRVIKNKGSLKMSEEYRVKINHTNGKEEAWPTTENPKQAGEQYKNMKRNLQPGSSVELQKRATNPWQTIEKERYNE